MFEKIFSVDENNKITGVEDVRIYANATISFSFDLNELDKVQEMHKKIKEEINLYTNLKINSDVNRDEVIIRKKGDSWI